MSNAKKLRLIHEVANAMRMHQNSVDRLDEAASEYLGINRTDLRCADIVQRSERVTAGDLAKEMGLTTGAVTGILDRLERTGMVRRVRDPKDRRRVFVEPANFRSVWAVYGPIARESAPMLARYAEAELKLIRDFLVDAREFEQAHAERVRSMTRAKAGRKKRR